MFEFIIAVLNKILQFLRDIVLNVISLLPDSPFQTLQLPDILRDYIAYLNYFVPVYDMLCFTLAWLSAILVWYTARWVLRIAKFIQ